MARLMSIAVIGIVIAAMLHFSAAKEHVVGDSFGWRLPLQKKDRYTIWANGRQFVVGDTLVFNFASDDGKDNVVELSKDAFDVCDVSSPMGGPFTSNPVKITLDEERTYYFACSKGRIDRGTGRRCNSSQKLAIEVRAASSTSIPTLQRRKRRGRTGKP